MPDESTDRYTSIIEIDECGLKRTRELLAEGYKIIGIFQATRLIPGAEGAPPYVRRGPRYVLAKYAEEDSLD